MTIIRAGATEKYATGWEQAFAKAEKKARAGGAASKSKTKSAAKKQKTAAKKGKQKKAARKGK